MSTTTRQALSARKLTCQGKFSVKKALPVTQLSPGNFGLQTLPTLGSRVSLSTLPLNPSLSDHQPVTSPGWTSLTRKSLGRASCVLRAQSAAEATRHLRAESRANQRWPRPGKLSEGCSELWCLRKRGGGTDSGRRA